ncbi:MAG: class I SAM-dependent methyltransferase [Chloroflexi bacterium]|nr:class I SAM-dependent methyltransferase [Chloroflexota bacterium]
MSEYDVFAPFYDADTATVVDDIPFYVALAKRTGGPVLEVACGTGRLLVPLARAGFEVVGIDVSTAMLDIAREKLRQAGLLSRARLIQADVRAFDLGRTFPLAFVALNSFTHLTTPDDQLAALERLRAHVAPDGLLSLDLPNPEATVIGDSAGQLIHEYTKPYGTAGEMLLKLRSQRVDTAQQVVDVTFLYDLITPDGHVRRTVAPFRLRYLYCREAELLLAQAGFRVESVYGDYELGPYEAASEKLVVIARRL